MVAQHLGASVTRGRRPRHDARVAVRLAHCGLRGRRRGGVQRLGGDGPGQLLPLSDAHGVLGGDAEHVLGRVGEARHGQVVVGGDARLLPHHAQCFPLLHDVAQDVAAAVTGRRRPGQLHGVGGFWQAAQVAWGAGLV